MIKEILLAEDDRGTALVVKNQLESKGYRVHIAINGLEALKALSIQKIDLIITDVVMPKMDGVDLYEAVKKNPKTEGIPIIIVTDKAIFKESFTQLGVSNFVEKTTNIKILIEKISSIDLQLEQAKKYPKILLCSNQKNALEQMVHTLKEHHYLVSSAESSQDLLSKSLMMKPKAIVIDVTFQDAVSAHELIKAIRCMGFLSQTKIITYAYFPENLGIDVESVKNMEEEMHLCNEAGADKYMGRFNPSYLLENLNDLGI